MLEKQLKMQNESTKLSLCVLRKHLFFHAIIIMLYKSSLMQRNNELIYIYFSQLSSFLFVAQNHIFATKGFTISAS